VVDHYRFLEDPDSEATKAWVTAQNEITNKYLDTCELREKIRSKVTDVWNYEKVGIPNKHGEFYYFNYNTGL
jgi:prolyl oligopeptidase